PLAGLAVTGFGCYHRLSILSRKEPSRMASGACDICSKTTMFGRHIRHKHSGRWERKAPKKSRFFRPNVAKQRVFVAGDWHRVNICTRCLRTLAKTA
ncbi:MAG: L28 family ribosomal protein, partial [Tepidiformaceae bacterium]